MRFSVYVLASLCSAAGMVYYAWLTREQQFFPAAVWIATNKFCIMVSVCDSPAHAPL